ncbi:Gfo/Idh/MocA family protein [Sagittula stellata]|uniref:Probable oxidoreductase protein n=1 Tax=Sagittula stellata (strain ATCC 700073 / DSM 11524 / E-37) TaxID=388399 RepID=A3K5V8_SAGS3|nr:Gfo/Idh/MocA family oxidoreductase [Sagittula stellata]EBA07497.1 probable oxidoreductase protein [Sagittula stellata E-37]
MTGIGVGVIGTGFMGKAHALGWRNARAVLGGNLPDVRMEMLCEMPMAKAEQLAGQFGFARATDDWRALVNDPDVDVVSITTPNNLHREMALEALKAGKHVWCEKPMALTLADAEEMEAAARAAGVVTMLGYNYIRNPAYQHARRMIEDGRIGRVVHVRGWVDEDYQADPDLPWTWRAKLADAGLGTLGDLGCHLVSMIVGLAGPVESLVADMQVVHESRPLADGSGRSPVENEDTATALIRFANGAHGSISTSRSAWGRKNRLDWEIHGTKGMICFAQERMNELQVYLNEGPRGEQGFRTILTGPDHPPFGAFVPAPGHQIGFNDLKVIEAAELLTAIRDGAQAYPSMTDALGFEKVIHAIAESARSGSVRVTL